MNERLPRCLVLLLAVCLGQSSCQRSESQGRYDSAGVLLEVRFPDPGQQHGEGAFGRLTNTSLVQQVEFHFSARPDPSSVGALTLPVRSETGDPVSGTYQVDDTRVVFTPALPLRLPATDTTGSTSIGDDNGGAGLFPETRYEVVAAPGRWDFLVEVAPSLLEVYADPREPGTAVLNFETTGDAELFFTGLPDRRPQLIDVAPRDGSVDVSPQLFTDPEQRFPPPTPFTLTFDAPLHPGLNEELDRFVLVDLDHASHPMELGIDVRLISNELNRAVVSVEPSGILPFGHVLSLEYSDPIRGLSQSPQPVQETTVASTFRIADAGAESIVDELRESFEDSHRRNPDPGLAADGLPRADWNEADSHVLQAAFGFRGNGELGRFVPPPPPRGEIRTIVIDTDRQTFPLNDGSTPDAPAIVVAGGLLSFTDIVVPKGVLLAVHGSNPLVITATGSVTFDGVIQIHGYDGRRDHNWDSGSIANSGGLGGASAGRGGASHPTVFWPPDSISNLNLVSPISSENGFGPADREPIGGGGGRCGIGDTANASGHFATDKEISCHEVEDANRNGITKPPGGGGGSYLAAGIEPRHGLGNIRPDGRGGWTADKEKLPAGTSGRSPFVDANPDNDFIGGVGELPTIQGGQGGGGGASASEGYYCGGWCHRDEDASNDGACDGPEVPGYGDSVSDARGGGGGGGGGSVQIQALGSIHLTKRARLLAFGGNGAGGEQIGLSNWGGSGGGGSGGAVVIQSAQSIQINEGAVIDVRGGMGAPACGCDGYHYEGCNGCNPVSSARGAGGDGGGGVVQLQVPAGQVADVQGAISPIDSWVDPANVRNPVQFGAESIAVSTWFDLGRTITRPPLGSMPIYEFVGLDAQGFVETAADGTVVDPRFIQCDYLGRRSEYGGYDNGEEPRTDFIPANTTIRVEFEAGDAIEPGSKEVDPDSLTGWHPHPRELAGHQFLRYRITFNLSADGSPLGPQPRRPVVNDIRIRCEF